MFRPAHREWHVGVDIGPVGWLTEGNEPNPEYGWFTGISTGMNGSGEGDILDNGFCSGGSGTSGFVGDGFSEVGYQFKYISQAMVELSWT